MIHEGSKTSIKRRRANLPNFWEQPGAKNVLDSMLEQFIAVDRDYNILYVNKAVTERTGKPANKYVGKNHWKLWPTMVGTVVDESFEHAFRTGIPVRFEYFYEPTAVWIDVNAYRNGDQLHVYFRDITKEKEAERELARREESLNTVLDAIPQVAWATDGEGALIYINARWEEFTGTPGMQNDALRSAIHPEDLPRIVEIMKRSRQAGNPEPYELRIRRKDGQYCWHRVEWSPLFDKSGEAVQWIGTTTNVHEQRLAEEALRQSEERYRQLAENLDKQVQDRTSELQAAYREQEAFSYSVSHDLRAPLRSIVASARILEEDYGKLLPAEATKILKRQADAALKLAHLIDDLLELSRVGRQDLIREDVDLTNLFQTVSNAMDRPFGIKFFFQPHLRARCDERLMRQVAQNLLENAVKFSPNGGGVWFGQKHGAYYVMDRGIGFDPAYSSKLFQVFQRLHNESEFPGTGIGLASVKRIVERHGGKVWAEGQPGKGATFYFTL